LNLDEINSKIIIFGDSKLLDEEWEKITWGICQTDSYLKSRAFSVIELFKYGYNSGRDPKFYFFRDTNGHEVDLIMQKGSNLIPIEIKSSRTYSTAFLEGLEFFHRTAEKKAKSGFIVYQGEASQKIKEFYLYSMEKATDIMDF
jgi:predicted AAA+ superfamily ATPase